MFLLILVSGKNSIKCEYIFIKSFLSVLNLIYVRLDQNLYFLLTYKCLAKELSELLSKNIVLEEYRYKHFTPLK